MLQQNLLLPTPDKLTLNILGVKTDFLYKFAKNNLIMTTPITLQITDYILFALLRAALWNELPHPHMFGSNCLPVQDPQTGKPTQFTITPQTWENLSEQEWKTIIKQSTRQGVKAIAYDGLCKIAEHIPNAINIPRNLKITWAINTQKVEEQYVHHIQTAQDLATLLKENGIPQTTILKGLGLSTFYPIPNHRECGDIDIYLHDHYKKCNQLIQNTGAKINIHYEKHSSFFYKKIEIENHQYFLNKQVYKIDRHLEQELNKYIADTKPFLNPYNSLTVPSPNFNTIFLTRHMITHIGMGSILRQYTDWCTYLNANKEKIDVKAITATFKKEKMAPIVNAINYFSINYLGMPTNLFPEFGPEDKTITSKLIQNFNKQKVEFRTNNKIGIFAYKIKKVLYQNLYESKLIHSTSQTALLIRIIVRQLGRPAEIFRK